MFAAHACCNSKDDVDSTHYLSGLFLSDKHRALGGMFLQGLDST